MFNFASLQEDTVQNLPDFQNFPGLDYFAEVFLGLVSVLQKDEEMEEVPRSPKQHKASDVKAKQIPARPTFSLVEVAAGAAELSSMFAPRLQYTAVYRRQRELT